MKRLTAIEENGNAFYPYCFREDTKWVDLT